MRKEAGREEGAPGGRAGTRRQRQEREGGAALRIRARPHARARLRERGLLATEVRVVPAAAGGPKGLILNPLDRFLFGHCGNLCRMGRAIAHDGKLACVNARRAELSGLIDAQH